MTNDNRIIIAGCGPGHPDYLTDEVRKAVADAELLVGAPHLLALFAESKAETYTVDAHMKAATDRIAAAAEDRRVVVLVSGDTGLYSLARTLLNRFGRHRCTLIPGISSIQLACARLALDWSDLTMISAHGRDPEQSVDDLAGCDKIAVLAGTAKASRWAASLLQTLGEGYTAFACENLSWPEEQITELDAAGLRDAELASRTIILLLSRELLA